MWQGVCFTVHWKPGLHEEAHRAVGEPYRVRIAARTPGCRTSMLRTGNTHAQGALPSPRPPLHALATGHYVPTLALEIIKGNQGADGHPINLKGLLVGNAWTDAHLDNHGALDFWFGHGLISFTAYDGILKYCDFGKVGPLKQVLSGRVRWRLLEPSKGVKGSACLLLETNASPPLSS